MSGLVDVLSFQGSLSVNALLSWCVNHGLDSETLVIVSGKGLLDIFRIDASLFSNILYTAHDVATC
jgi:hypothetical protein